MKNTQNWIKSEWEFQSTSLLFIDCSQNCCQLCFFFWQSSSSDNSIAILWPRIITTLFCKPNQKLTEIFSFKLRRHNLLIYCDDCRACFSPPFLPKYLRCSGIQFHSVVCWSEGFENLNILSALKEWVRERRASHFN